MQKSATKPVKKIARDSDIRAEVINHYIAQAANDPSALKPGQTVTDTAGKSMTVVENDPMTTNVVMAPSDQMANQPAMVEGQPVDTTNLQGLETVDDMQMIDYTIDNPSDPSVATGLTPAGESSNPYGGSY